MTRFVAASDCRAWFDPVDAVDDRDMLPPLRRERECVRFDEQTDVESRDYGLGGTANQMVRVPDCWYIAG